MSVCWRVFALLFSSRHLPPVLTLSSSLSTPSPLPRLPLSGTSARGAGRFLLSSQSLPVSHTRTHTHTPHVSAEASSVSFPLPPSATLSLRHTRKHTHTLSLSLSLSLSLPLPNSSPSSLPLSYFLSLPPSSSLPPSPPPSLPLPLSPSLPPSLSYRDQLMAFRVKVAEGLFDRRLCHTCRACVRVRVRVLFRRRRIQYQEGAC